MNENPLSEEQLKKLGEILKLSPEEQKEALSQFLQTLTPEQVNFLKKQQAQAGGQCVFCLMIDGKIPCYKIYEDSACIGVLDINPATKGHVILFPKAHCKTVDEFRDASKLFAAASKISRTLMKIGAEGTNLFIANGAIAGQAGQHALVHIIPRYANDGVNFSWASMQIDEDEMKVIAAKIEKNIPREIDTKAKSAEADMKKIIYSERIAR